MKETNIVRDILLSIPRTARLFRNNVGTGWVGRIVHQTPQRITLDFPRPLHAGLCAGSSDLIGWQTITITPEMVGKQIAVFTAIEVKTATGKPTPEQLNFIEIVRKSGGIAGISTDPESAKKIILSWQEMP